MVYWERVEWYVYDSKTVLHTHTDTHTCTHRHTHIITNICVSPGSFLSSLQSHIHSALIWVLKFEPLQLLNESVAVFICPLCRRGSTVDVRVHFIRNDGQLQQARAEVAQSEPTLIWAWTAAVVNRGWMNPWKMMSCWGFNNEVYTI